MAKKKVLLVDDDKYTHELVKHEIESLDVDVELHNAYTALEAFEEIRTGSYDIVLVDQKIEVMQGTDVIRSIKHIPIKSDVYIFTGFEKEYVEYQAKDIKNFIKGILHKGDMKKVFKELFSVKK